MTDFFTEETLEDEAVYFKCQNYLCQLYFQPEIKVLQRKDVHLSNGEQVSVDAAHFACPACETLYNGIALSRRLPTGKEIVIMFLRTPHIIKIGKATVAS